MRADAEPYALPSWCVAWQCPARRERNQVIMTQTLRCKISIEKRGETACLMRDIASTD